MSISAASNSAAKPPITCHVLDTVKGAPGASIACTLTLVRPGIVSHAFVARTNNDGRVTSWQAEGENKPSLESVFEDAKTRLASGDEPSERQAMLWSLKLDAGTYFAGDTFWEMVEIRFKTSLADGRAHWHVPVLLSPWSYTTYRGS